MSERLTSSLTQNGKQPVVLSNRNVVINGAMQVAQRGTSTASITTVGYYTADRWNLDPSSLGTWTQSVESDAPTGSGFRNSLKVLCTTADASPASTDYFLTRHRIEGQNLQQFLKGTASAKKFALSFWVKSNVTGTYVVGLEDVDNSRLVGLTYSISTSATWEKKTIIFPADTTGTLDNDNAQSLLLNFWLAAGSNFTSSSLQTTWGAANFTNGTIAAGQTNLAAATSNYWQVTGIQLEVGSVATPFEFEDFGMTLAKCQRYYQIIAKCTSASDIVFGNGTYTSATRFDLCSIFSNPMRGTPSLVATSAVGAYYVAGATLDGFNSLTLYSTPNAVSETTRMAVYNTTEMSGTAGYSGHVHASGSTLTLVAFSSEL